MKLKIALIAVGVFLGIYLEWSDNFFLSAVENKVKYLLYYFVQDALPSGTQNCQIPYINNTYESDTLIVGHAYGSITRIEKGTFSPYLKEFLHNPDFKPRRVIFTGDVLPNPSNYNWRSFKEEMNSLGLKIIIAPGNHDADTGDNASRDIFFQNFDINYPLIEEDVDRVMVFLDSTIEFGMIGKDLINYLENYGHSDKTLFIFSHHILRPNPLGIANSIVNMNLKLNNIKELYFAKDNFKNIFLISGDSGAYGQELDCIKNENISFISSGIGDFADDKVLILRGTKLFKKDLRQ